jgi:hypothetical protein
MLVLIQIGQLLLGDAPHSLAEDTELGADGAQGVGSFAESAEPGVEDARVSVLNLEPETRLLSTRPTQRISLVRCRRVERKGLVSLVVF